MLIASLLLCPSIAACAGEQVNYDEHKVPQYTLPPLLVTSDGREVTNTDDWRLRRAEILRLFETNVYGKSAPPPKTMRFEVKTIAADALGGKATRKQVTIFFTDRPTGPQMDVLLLVPNAARKPVPAFLGVNILDEQCAMLMERGYALANVANNKLEPDRIGGWKKGLRAAFHPQGVDAVFQPDDWGAIGVWAWGLSRAMDYFQTAANTDIDAKRVIVIGHSRCGKTALWAGAQDERFAMVVSNDSGCAGTALSRRKFGETVKAINTAFPYWFCENFKKYNDNENHLPVDQHMLIALIAPRPVYVASAAEDHWADPRGEFLAAKGVEPVYRLLGQDGLASDHMPPLDTPLLKGTIGYHIRRGKHDLTEYDWRQYLDFATRHLRAERERGNEQIKRTVAGQSPE